MIRAVNEAAFASAVIDRSHAIPVVVDFWAAWCQPCRFLTPVLEQVATDFAGRVELVAVDTDANQVLAAQLGIQGIPAVKAFWAGTIVDEFTGAQPEPVVRGFFESVAGLRDREAARIAALAEARRLAEGGDRAAARELLAQFPADEGIRQLLAEMDLGEAGVALEDPEPALKDLLERVVADDDREQARERMLQIFEALGHDHPLTVRYRARLASALF